MKTSKIGFLGAVAVIASIGLAGCGKEARQHARGFHLPEGDIEVGKTTFVEMQCNRCHTVEGVELPDNNLHGLPMINLGGEIYRVKSYGDLVTSIINPQHVVSPKFLAILSDEEKKADIGSPMPVFNDELTVRQLIDLVAVLHSRYQLIEPGTNEYYYLMP